MCLIVYTYLEDQYEQETFHSLQAYVLKSFNGKPVNEDTAFARGMHLVYGLETMHRQVFSAAAVGGFIANDIHPVSYDFTTGQGACGSSSLVLGRLLLSMHYTVRFAHMEVDGQPGGHHILEVKLRDRWVVADPLYDLYFVRPDGRMATFSDVRDNWARYKQQAPPLSHMRYSYAALTHTNWKKIPLITPAVKGILNLVIGKERADAVSLRTIFLRKFHFLFIVLAVAWAIVFSVTARRLWQQRRRRAPMQVIYGPYTASQPSVHLVHA